MCYRTRSNPVQGSVYRRWHSLLVGSHTRLYVIWCLDLLSLSVCIFMCVYTRTNILLKYCLVVCLLKFLLSPWCSIFFSELQPTKRCLYDCRTWGSKIHISGQPAFKWLSGFVVSQSGSQWVRFSIYPPESSISPLGLIFRSRCMYFSWGLDS